MGRRTRRRAPGVPSPRLPTFPLEQRLQTLVAQALQARLDRVQPGSTLALDLECCLDIKLYSTAPGTLLRVLEEEPWSGAPVRICALSESLESARQREEHVNQQARARFPDWEPTPLPRHGAKYGPSAVDQVRELEDRLLATCALHYPATDIEISLIRRLTCFIGLNSPTSESLIAEVTRTLPGIICGWRGDRVTITSGSAWGKLDTTQRP